MNRMFLSFLNSMQTNSQNAQNPGLWVNGMRQPIREENAGKIDRNLLRKGNEEQDNPRNFEDEPVLAADGIMDVVKPILSTKSWPGSMLGNPAPRGGTDVNQMGTDNVIDIEQGTRDEEAARLAATAKANPDLTDRMKQDPRNHAALIRAGKMTQQEADNSTKPKSTNTKQDNGYNPGGIMSGQYMPKAMQENTNRSMFLTHLQSMQTKSQDAQNPGLWVNGNRMPVQESLLGAAVRGIGQVAKFGYNLGNNLGNGMMNAANTAVSGSPLKPYPQPSPFRPEPLQPKPLQPSIRPPRPLRPSPGQSPYPPGPGEDGGDAGAVRPDQDPDRFRPRPEQQIGSMLVPFDPPGRRPHPDYPIGPPGYRPRPSPGWRPDIEPGSTPDWAPDYPYPKPYTPRPSPGGRLPGLINPKPKSPTEITVDDIINPNTGNVSLSTGEANKPGAVTLHPEGQNILNPPAKPKFDPQKDYIRPRPGTYPNLDVKRRPNLDVIGGPDDPYAPGGSKDELMQRRIMEPIKRWKQKNPDQNIYGKEPLGIIPLQADPNLMNRMY